MACYREVCLTTTISQFAKIQKKVKVAHRGRFFFVDITPHRASEGHRGRKLGAVVACRWGIPLRSGEFRFAQGSSAALWGITQSTHQKTKVACPEGQATIFSNRR